MKTNVGSYDAAVRFVGGCVVLFFSVNGLGWWALLGLIPVLSAVCAFCPVYWVFGIDTAKWERGFDRRHPHGPASFG